MSNFFEELKNRNVYKVATASIPTTPPYLKTYIVLLRQYILMCMSNLDFLITLCPKFITSGITHLHQPLLLLSWYGADNGTRKNA